MFLSSRQELIVLLGTFAGGMILGIVFDFFRILRKNFKGASSVVWLQDVLMWAIMLAVVYTTLFITNNAQIRWYEFLGFGSGAAVYMVAFSRWIVLVSNAVISFFKKIFGWLFFIVAFPFRLVAKPIKSISRWLNKRLKSFFSRQKTNFFRFSRIFKKI